MEENLEHLKGRLNLTLKKYSYTYINTNQRYRYKLAIEEGQKLAMKKYYILSILLGSVFMIMYTAYGIAFWYGSNLIVDGISSPGSIFTVRKSKVN